MLAASTSIDVVLNVFYVGTSNCSVIIIMIITVVVVGD